MIAYPLILSFPRKGGQNQPLSLFGVSEGGDEVHGTFGVGRELSWMGGIRYVVYYVYTRGRPQGAAEG